MTPNSSALLARIATGLFQQAWVVRDLDAAAAAMQETMGCSEFTRFTMDEKWDLRGREVRGSLSLGFCRAGDVQIELMQPLEGEGIQREFLVAHGPGFHHLAAIVPDLDAGVDAARGDGFVPVMSGGFGSVRVCYLDTYSALGYYVELIEDPDDMLWATRPWRDEQPSRDVRSQL